jgi:hypothetical protein
VEISTPTEQCDCSVSEEPKAQIPEQKNIISFISLSHKRWSHDF